MITTNEWDPLERDSIVDSDIVNGSKKRQIRNILKSYVGFFDPFSELLQNALDAVEKRKRHLKEEGYKPKIWLKIDQSANQFSITDNRIGFSEKEFKSFLAPNISFKDGEELVTYLNDVDAAQIIQKEKYGNNLFN
jgi:hypothetical protein